MIITKRSKGRETLNSQLYQTIRGTMLSLFKIRICLVSAWIFNLADVSFAADDKFHEQAFRIHERLACEPPSKDILDRMAQLLSEGNGDAAAEVAMGQPGFLNCTVKRWCMVQTNVDMLADQPLNDYCATVIGAVRDNKPFGELLYSDTIYRADPALDATISPYKPSENKHYEELEKKHPNFAQFLIEKKQSEIAEISKPAGLLTTRAFGEAFLSAGTNRRAVRFSMINYLCNDLEQLSDVTRPDEMVGRDVERDPGGDASLYNSKCKGCHAGQDYFRGAFANYDFVGGKLSYFPYVTSKYANNANFFPSGYVTVDDRWKNNWIEGQNGKLGWPVDKIEGNGVASFGEMLANTAYFNVCMTKRVFKSVCHRDPTETQDNESVLQLTQAFRLSKQNLKVLFGKSALVCSSEN